MRSEVEENETRVKSSSRSLFSSLFAPPTLPYKSLVSPSKASRIDDEDEDDLVEKKRKIDDRDGEERLIDESVERGKLSRSTVPFPNWISVSKETTESTSMQRFQLGGVEEESKQNVAVIPAVAPFPVLTSQQGFVRFGTELAPVFPGLNNSWCPQPVVNPYQYCYFPYNSMCVSSEVAPNLKRKVEDPWNCHNPPQMEGLNGHIPVFHASFVPIQAMFQNPFFPAVRGPPLNHSPSATLSKNQELNVCATSRGIHDDNPFVPKPASITKSEDLNVCATSRGPQDDNPLDDSASVPMKKRKMVCPSFLSRSGITVPLDGNNNTNSEPPARHVFPILREDNAAESTQRVRQSLGSTSFEPQSGYLTGASSYRLEEEKEIEEKGWVVLVQKELRNTDVGNLGRIVLPKKDAEANLPQLVAKDGLILQMEDMSYSIKWKFKYRYWPNNKSRMYVMENTGDFVRMHNLQTGDFFIVYREESSGKYIARGKKGMKPLYVGEDRRSEEGETEARNQFSTKRRTMISTNGCIDEKSENGASAMREPFAFGRETGRSSQFITPL